MSFNQPPPQPGYGQQPPPQPQTPYGYPQQQPQQPAPGYGYPQQPAPSMPPQPGPYGQQPWGQQPQQAGWGGPPPPLPAGGGAGKTIGIIAAVVVVLGLIGGGVALLSGGVVGGGGGDYKIHLGTTLLESYIREGDQKEGDASNGTSDTSITDAQSVTAVYKDATSQLSVGGAYGDIGNPEAAVEEMLSKGLTSSSNSATEQHPSGFDGDVMKCGDLGDTEVLSMPYCAWGDDSSVAVVFYVHTDPTGSGEVPTITEFAETTAKIRDEVRVKK